MTRSRGVPTGDADYLGERWREAGALAGFEPDIRQGPALFLAGIGVILALVGAAAAAIWYMTAPRLAQFWGALPSLMGAVAAAAVLYGVAEWMALVATVVTGKYALLPLGRWGRGVIKVAPLTQRIARPIGSTRDRMVHSAVETWNAVEKARVRRPAGGPVLILLPRCLQWPECSQTITRDVDYCRRCGRCGVAEVLSLRDEYGDVVVAVLTGGSLAPGVIRECAPRGVIGVACERELLDGVAAVHGLPVLGIANQRPQGPCRATALRIEELRAALEAFYPARGVKEEGKP